MHKHAHNIAPKYCDSTEIVEVLGQIGGERAIRPIAALLHNKQTPTDVKCTSISVLGNIGGAEVLEILENVLRWGGHPYMSRAIVALGATKERRAVESLTSVIQNTQRRYHYEDLRSAIAALEGIGGSEAVKSLVLAVRNNNSGIRAAAAQALGRIGDPSAVDSLLKLVQTRTWKGSSQDEWGHYYSRCSAAEALGMIGSERSRKTLQRILDAEDDYYVTVVNDDFRRDYTLKEKAAEALRRISNT